MTQLKLSEIDIPALRTSFQFSSRPVLVPADLRPTWKIGLVVLLLKNCCRQGRTSLARMHVLNWSVRTNECRRQIEDVLQGRSNPGIVIVRFEPALNRAIDLALGEGLIDRPAGNRIVLSARGRRLAEEIEQSDAIYVLEKQFMTSVGQRITEAFVDRLFQEGQAR